jgi:hypothetical protein
MGSKEYTVEKTVWDSFAPDKRAEAQQLFDELRQDKIADYEYKHTRWLELVEEALGDDYSPEEIAALLEPDNEEEIPPTEQQLAWRAERIAIAEAFGVSPDRVVVDEDGRPLTQADLEQARKNFTDLFGENFEQGDNE